MIFPLKMTQAIKDLPPLKDDFNSLWEEMSYEIDGTMTMSAIGSHMNQWSEDLAVDLHRFNEGVIEELSGDLWLQWRKWRKGIEATDKTWRVGDIQYIRNKIRGKKKDITRQLTKEDYGDTLIEIEEYQRVMKQHRRLPIEKVGVEYSGFYYTNEELLSYFEDHKEVLEEISTGMSFEFFVDNFLPRLSSTPILTREYQGKNLGVSVPKYLLERVQDDIDYEMYDLSEATFQSKLSVRQLKTLQIKYDNAVSNVLVNKKEELEEAMQSFLESFVENKEKHSVYTNSNLVMSYNLKDVYHSILLDGSSFDSLYQKIEWKDLLKGDIKSKIENTGRSFDQSLVDEDQVKNSIRQIAEELLGLIKNIKLDKAVDQLKKQISACENVWKSSDKLNDFLDLLQNNEVTQDDVRACVKRHSPDPSNIALREFLNEILAEINVESYVNAISKKLHVGKSDGVKYKKVKYKFLQSSEDKLHEEIDRFLCENTVFDTLELRLKIYAKQRIKQIYANQNHIKVDQIKDNI